jgi:hypothetical protein
MKHILKKSLTRLFAFASIFGMSSSLFAAYDVTMQPTELNTTVYTQAPTGSIEHFLFASPLASNLPALAPGQSMLVKMLAPAGTTAVSIRGESMLWTGASGPVVAGFSDTPPEPCPVLVQTGVYGCGSTLLTIPNAGLSLAIYGGTALSSPRYMYLVMKNVDTRTFTFGSLAVTIKIGDVTMYKSWLNARPWAGGASTNSVDGLGVVEQPSVSTVACQTSTASLLTKVNPVDLSINIPNIDLNSLGMKNWSVKLVYKAGVDGSLGWTLGDMQPLNCVLQ